MLKSNPFPATRLSRRFVLQLISRNIPLVAWLKVESQSDGLSMLIDALKSLIADPWGATDLKFRDSFNAIFF